jgi:hypothetical protein
MVPAVTRADIETVIARWDFPPSEISDHGRRCCADAQDWFALMDRSSSKDRAAPVTPAWMNHRWTWGAGRWPLHWCQAVRMKELDCGALAAFARRALEGRSVPHATVQLVQLYTDEACAHWERTWSAEGGSTRWLAPPLVYHEAVALEHPATGEIQLWDPSRGRWMDEPEVIGYGTNVAARVWPGPGWKRPLAFGGSTLVDGAWSVRPL